MAKRKSKEFVSLEYDPIKIHRMRIKEEWEEWKKSYGSFILFIDTETEDFVHDLEAPATDTFNWPRLIQLGYIKTDEYGKEYEKGSLLVKPEGFSVSNEWLDAHGISTDEMLEESMPITEVLKKVKSLLHGVDCIVGHHVEYDINVINSEFQREYSKNSKNKKFGSLPLDGIFFICTMKSSVDYCKIPGEVGFKYPKLQELYKTLFKRTFRDAHNALADVKATEKCFWKLVELNIVKKNDILKTLDSSTKNDLVYDFKICTGFSESYDKIFGVFREEVIVFYKSWRKEGPYFAVGETIKNKYGGYLIGNQIPNPIIPGINKLTTWQMKHQKEADEEIKKRKEWEKRMNQDVPRSNGCMVELLVLILSTITFCLIF